MRLLLLFIMFISVAEAQPNLQWKHRFNGTSHYGDRAAKVIFDNAGNVISVGYVSNACTGEDFITVKFDNTGQKLWSRYYTGFGLNSDNEDRATDVDVDNQNNIYVTGYSEAVNVSYMSTVKYSPAGVELWSVRYNTTESYATSIDVDDSGNVYVAGYKTVSFDDDMFLIKYNSAGVEQWNRTYAVGFEDQAVDVQADNNGSVYITGFIWTNANSYDWATVKFSSGGVQQWANTYNSVLGSYSDKAVALVLDNAGDVYVTGDSRHFANTDDDIVTIKYTSAGGTAWTCPWTGAPQVMDDNAKGIVVDNNGNAYVLGGSYGQGTMLDIVTIKINSAGLVDWANTVDSLQKNDYPWGINIDDSGQNIYVMGDVNIGPDVYSDRDFFFLHYNPAGAELNRNTFNGIGNSFDVPFGIAIDGNGNIAATGVASISAYDTDLSVVMLDPQLNILWSGYHNGQSYVDDIGRDFYVDPAGNSYACGSFYNYWHLEDVIVFKVNTSGQRIWTYEWPGLVIEGSEIALKLAVDNTGNVYVAGSMDTTAAQTDKNIFVLKLDMNGQLVWRKDFAGSAGGHDVPVGIKIGSNGNIYVAGNTVNTATGADGFGICYDPAGNIVWAATYDGGGQGEIFMAMAMDAQDNLYAAGLLNPLSGALSDGLVVKFTSAGTIAWDSTYNNATATSPRDFFNSIAIDANGNVFVAGLSNQNWVTAKYTPAGVREWTQNYSYSSQFDSACTVVVDGDNNVIVGGVFGQFSGQDMGIIKYRNDSTQVWVKRFPNSAGSDDMLTQLAVDDTNNIYAIGWETSATTINYQFLVLKYDSLGTLKYDFFYTDSLANAPDFGKRIAFDGNANMYLMGDVSDHCFGNTFVNGFRYDIQINKYGYSSGVGFEEMASKDALISAWPNPASDQLTLQLNETAWKNAPVQVSFYDINGRMLRNVTLNGKLLNVNTKEFPAGIVFYIAEQGEIRSTGKVVIMK